MTSIPENALKRKEIISVFKGHNIELTPAGKWRFGKKGETKKTQNGERSVEGKKVAIDANRKDYLDLADYPDDNMFRHKIEDSGYLCVDFDGDRIPESFLDQIPTLRDTFYSTTTRASNQHRYLAPPEGKQWTTGRQTKFEADGVRIDLLTSGVIFEGHLHNLSDSKYSMNDKEILPVSDQEYEALEKWLMPVPKKAKSEPKADQKGTKYDLPSASTLLIENGYKRIFSNRLLCPNSESGVAGVHVFDDGGVYSHHSSENDWLADGSSHDGFDVYAHYFHNGDKKSAHKDLQEQGRVFENVDLTTFAKTEGTIEKITRSLDAKNGKGVKSIDKFIAFCQKEPALTYSQAKRISDMLDSWLRMRDYKDRFNEPKKFLEAFTEEIDPLEILKGYAMTKKVRKKYEELVHLYDGLIVQGYHIYVYGNAGSGKTTTMFYLMITMAQDHPDKQFVFFYLDGALNMASAMDQYVEELELNNVMLLTEGSASDYKEVMDKFVKSGADLTEYVFFYDTFKYMSRNVNDKNSNKEAMHSIKALNKLGATFITLGHTNKDGKRESGTAELEQDSDAMIRVDSIENNGRIVTSLSKGGRCRFDLKERSFSYVAGDPTSVIEESEFMVIDDDQEIKVLVNEIKELLKDGQKSTKEIQEVFSGGRNKLLKILHSHADKIGYWNVERGEKNTQLYSLSKNIEDDLGFE